MNRVLWEESLLYLGWVLMEVINVLGSANKDSWYVDAEGALQVRPLRRSSSSEEQMGHCRRRRYVCLMRTAPVGISSAIHFVTNDLTQWTAESRRCESIWQLSPSLRIKALYSTISYKGERMLDLSRVPSRRTAPYPRVIGCGKWRLG